MIQLHGSAVSNYDNKVKLALLEKNVPFTEAHQGTRSTDEAVLAASPLAKIPYVATDQGSLSESQAILEWLEDAFAQPPRRTSRLPAPGEVLAVRGGRAVHPGRAQQRPRQRRTRHWAWRRPATEAGGRRRFASPSQHQCGPFPVAFNSMARVRRALQRTWLRGRNLWKVPRAQAHLPVQLKQR